MELDKYVSAGFKKYHYDGCVGFEKVVLNTRNCKVIHDVSEYFDDEDRPYNSHVVRIEFKHCRRQKELPCTITPSKFSVFCQEKIECDVLSVFKENGVDSDMPEYNYISFFVKDSNSILTEFIEYVKKVVIYYEEDYWSEVT